MNIVEKRLAYWIDGINNTTLCKYRKAKARAYLIHVFSNITEDTIMGQDLDGFSLGSNTFITLFSWDGGEGFDFWQKVNEELTKINKNKYYE